MELACGELDLYKFSQSCTLISCRAINIISEQTNKNQAAQPLPQLSIIHCQLSIRVIFANHFIKVFLRDDRYAEFVGFIELAACGFACENVVCLF